MARPALKRMLWIVLAAGAAALIAGLSLRGERPSLLHEQQAAGVIRDLPLDSLREVEMRDGPLHWRFVRGASGGWTAADADRALPTDFAAQLDTALKLLHRSAPQRTLPAADLADKTPGQFGLDPPLMTVAVSDGNGRRFDVAFGARNPMGLATYVRVDKGPDILLLSEYVLTTLQSVVRAP